MTWRLDKFPRTPHIPGSSGAELRTEKLLGQAQVEDFMTLPVKVEEKLDGANLGISFEGTLPRFQNRGTLIEPGRTPPQFQPLYTWFAERQNGLLEALGERYVLFGEWLFARHTVAYGSLPDYFLAFDLWDREDGVFLAVEKRSEICIQAGIQEVPLLFDGILETIEKLQSLLGDSRYDGEAAEGLYVRLEENGQLKLRAKFVRPGWVEPGEIHWSKRAIEPNQIIRLPV